MWSLQSVAEEEPAAAEEESQEKKEPLMYYPVTPNILTFYQNDNKKKIGYVVVQVQVVVRGQDNFDLVESHLPLVQDTLIDYFNRQDKKTVEDLSLRDELRLKAKERVFEVIKEETGKEIVENLLFTQYIFQ